MSFKQANFAPVGANSTDTPKIFSYKTSDSLSTVVTSGYFDEKKFQLDQGDIILSDISNVLHILSVTSSSDTVITGEQSAPANQIIINSFADFPEPSGAVITLADDTFYLVGDNLPVTSDRFALGDNTVIAGLDSSVSSLSYSGLGAMFTAVDKSNKLTLLTLDCPNGMLHDISNPSDGGAVFQLINCTVDNVATIGNLDNLAAIQYSDVAFNNISVDGILFGGTISVFVGSTDLVTLNSAAGVFLDLGTAVFDSFDIESSFATLAAGSKFVSGLADSGNISANNTGRISNVKSFGTGSFLDGLSVDDVRWDFFGNDAAADTRPDGFLSLTGNAVATTISIVSTPVLVSGVWSIEKTSRFTGTTNGRLTYNGEKPITLPIIITVTAESASGSNKDVAFYVAITGVVQASSKTRANLSANDVKNQTVVWQQELQPNDFIELYVENNTDTIGVLVEDAKMVVN